MNDEQTKNMQQWARIIAKAWADEDFRAKLLADPAVVLRSEGMDVPEGMTLKVVENTDATTHIVIPAKPRGDKAETLDVRVQALICNMTF